MNYLSGSAMVLSFHDQLDGEEYEFSFGKHWFLLLTRTFAFFLFLGFFASVPFLVHIFFPNTSFQADMVMYLADFLLVTLIIHKFFLWVLSYSLTFVIVTNIRIIIVKKSVFMISEKEILDLIQIRDIQMAKSGLLGNILQYGDIKLVLSMQGKDTTTLRDIPYPAEIQERCNLIRHERLTETGKRPKQLLSPEKALQKLQMETHSRISVPQAGIPYFEHKSPTRTH